MDEKLKMPEDLRDHIRQTGCLVPEPATGIRWSDEGGVQIMVFDDDVEFEGKTWRCIIVERWIWSNRHSEAIDSTEDIYTDAWPIWEKMKVWVFDWGNSSGLEVPLRSGDLEQSNDGRLEVCYHRTPLTRSIWSFPPDSMGKDIFLSEDEARAAFAELNRRRVEQRLTPLTLI